MTGLKERLRGNSSHWADVMRQAADEIERLEARVVELEGALDAMTDSFELLVNETDDEFTSRDMEIIATARAALAKSRGETP